MTKEITKAYILQQVQDKFGLREFEPEVFTFSERVAPVYNIERHLEHRKIQYAEKSVTTTGNLLFHAVPEDERWFVSRYDVIFMGAGAYTVAGVNIRRTDGDPLTVYLDMTAAQTVSYHVEMSNPVKLDALDRIYVNIDGYTSTQNLRLYIDHVVEDLR